MRQGDGPVVAKKMEVEVKRLYKSFLIMLEDLQDLHDQSFDVLHDNLPEEYQIALDQAEFFNEGRREYFRKKVLDQGNDCLRRLDFILKELERL